MRAFEKIAKTGSLVGICFQFVFEISIVNSAEIEKCIFEILGIELPVSVDRGEGADDHEFQVLDGGDSDVAAVFEVIAEPEADFFVDVLHLLGIGVVEIFDDVENFGVSAVIDFCEELTHAMAEDFEVLLGLAANLAQSFPIVLIGASVINNELLASLDSVDIDDLNDLGGNVFSPEGLLDI